MCPDAGHDHHLQALQVVSGREAGIQALLLQLVPVVWQALLPEVMLPPMWHGHR